MAKKKTQFNKAKFNKKSGILSYNYLGGEAGKGRGAVSIMQDGDDWYFVDKSGKVRTDVGINGKLTPTHMQNLENDGIFAAAKIKPDGTQLTKAEIKAGPDLGRPGSGGSATGDGDLPGRPGSNVNITPEGDLSPALAQRSNLRLRDANEAVAPNVDNARAPINYDQTLERRGMPTGDSWSPASGSDFSGSSAGSGPGANAPLTLPPSATIDPRQGDYGSTFQNWEGAGRMSLPSDPNRVPGNFESAGGVQKFNTQNTMANMRGPVYSSSVDPIAPGIDQKNLVIGEGGGTWDIDDSFYKQDGQIMKDAPWWKGGDRVATQADIDAGIKDQASPGMTSAEGWQAAGSIMKGVGGLASAYTGIKNYQLARDAFNTQKNQWQADYDQRLKAYEDNKQLANQDIEARNRTLQARGQTANQYSKLS